MLTDLSSKGGTWVSIKCGEPVAVTDNMEFRIGDVKSRSFKLKFIEKEFDKVRFWLYKNHLEHYKGKFEDLGLDHLESIQDT